MKKYAGKDGVVLNTSILLHKDTAFSSGENYNLNGRKQR